MFTCVEAPSGCDDPYKYNWDVHLFYRTTRRLPKRCISKNLMPKQYRVQDTQKYVTCTDTNSRQSWLDHLSKMLLRQRIWKKKRWTFIELAFDLIWNMLGPSRDFPSRRDIVTIMTCSTGCTREAKNWIDCKMFLMMCVKNTSISPYVLRTGPDATTPSNPQRSFTTCGTDTSTIGASTSSSNTTKVILGSCTTPTSKTWTPSIMSCHREKSTKFLEDFTKLGDSESRSSAAVRPCNSKGRPFRHELLNKTTHEVPFTNITANKQLRLWPCVSAIILLSRGKHSTTQASTERHKHRSKTNTTHASCTRDATAGNLMRMNFTVTTQLDWTAADIAAERTLEVSQQSMSARCSASRKRNSEPSFASTPEYTVTMKHHTVRNSYFTVNETTPSRAYFVNHLFQQTCRDYQSLTHSST